ncbi:acyltransferase [Devosia sp. MC521]|uniref:acyltransferase n=1 Tax=Devosia sp. MC521 TaxID=2759954 RepID=UPI0015F7AB93|nr:acyltransferase [Devosia sp. MC521]MBJ6989017.1 acyltransferase [Devosia sp. MC521]QMW62975.1 acyltransferase [Devosia sp. MC521]
MAYLSEQQVLGLGLKSVGTGVLISDKACIYNPEKISIGNHSRVDDFCVISGLVTIGDYSHITAMCLIAGGIPGVFLDHFCTLAYGVKIFAQSDDYSGETMVNSMVDREFKREIFLPVHAGRQVIMGAGSTVLPGVKLAEGTALGAMSLVNKSTTPWGIYAGVPARRLKDRKKDLLMLEQKYLEQQRNRL